MDTSKLIEEACKARKMSYSPYSGFAVGAALLGKNGEIFTGCNIENASYGATVCAERTAVFKAVSEGVTDFEAIAIAGGTEPCFPCGICRQVLSEFCEDNFQIILCNHKNEILTCTLQQLLPFSFSSKNLER